MSPNEYLLNRQNQTSDTQCPDLDLNKWRLRLRSFHLFVDTRCVHSFLAFCGFGVRSLRTLHDEDSRGAKVCFPSRWPSH